MVWTRPKAETLGLPVVPGQAASTSRNERRRTPAYDETSPGEPADRALRRSVVSRGARLLSAGVSISALLASCTIARHAPAGRPLYEYPGLVNAQFAAAGGYPKGLPWTRGGRAVQRTQISSVAGASRCGWLSAVLLTVAGDGRPGQVRQYVRDPNAVISQSLSRRWQRRTRLPAAARPTGYVTTGSIELWLTPDRSVAYLVPSINHNDSESWPESVPPVSCPR